MGVPGFFSWLLRKYKRSAVITKEIGTVDTLYLDANCLFHPQCFKVVDYVVSTGSSKNLEKMMFSRIVNYIKFLVEHVKPKRLFISVDGVAPVAKMSQQRKRRFKSVHDTAVKNSIKQKHNVKITDIWSNTVITPGTEFMVRLDTVLTEYTKNNSIETVYSSYKEPGEGEHKILQDIKNCKTTDCTVVYGLDADLIFLTMSCQKDNMYLLRESHVLSKDNVDKEPIQDITTDVSESLNYISIDGLKECVNSKMSDIITSKIDNIQIPDLTDDFTFICYFLGNDFLPHTPSVSIKSGGLDLLIDCYATIFCETGETIVSRTDTVQFNTVQLELFLKKVAGYEDYYFRKRLPVYLDKIKNKICPETDPYKEEMWKLENMQLFETEDNVRLGVGKPHQWKFRYYEEGTGVSVGQKKYIDSMCDEYIKGVLWTAKYYFEECPSWRWFYPFQTAPFISDIADHISKFNFSYKFEESEPVTPYVQLLSVLPPECSNLLPLKYRYLMTSAESPIIDMYPVEVKLDTTYKSMFWECEPLIPSIDVGRIIDVIKRDIK